MEWTVHRIYDNHQKYAQFKIFQTVLNMATVQRNSFHEIQSVPANLNTFIYLLSGSANFKVCETKTWFRQLGTYCAPTSGSATFWNVYLKSGSAGLNQGRCVPLSDFTWSASAPDHVRTMWKRCACDHGELATMLGIMLVTMLVTMLDQTTNRRPCWWPCWFFQVRFWPCQNHVMSNFLPC